MRTKLPDRRASETCSVTFTVEGGKDVNILITVGFDDGGAPKEVFCASFKAGTTMNSVVMDACILFSRLLQHGDLPPELLASMCHPPSMIGAIAAAVAECKGPQISRRRPPRPRRPRPPAPAAPPEGPVHPVTGGAMVEAP